MSSHALISDQDRLVVQFIDKLWMVRPELHFIRDPLQG